jgi:hypothetical protein
LFSYFDWLFAIGSQQGKPMAKEGSEEEKSWLLPQQMIFLFVISH